MISLSKLRAMKYLVCALSFFGVALLYSCVKDKGSIPVEDILSKCDSLNVTYSATVQPIINAKCAIPGCHTATGGNNIPLATYTQVKAKVDNGSFRNRVLVIANMPPAPLAPLPADEKEKLQCWLDAGAPNN